MTMVERHLWWGWRGPGLRCCGVRVVKRRSAKAGPPASRSPSQDSGRYWRWRPMSLRTSASANGTSTESKRASLLANISAIFPRLSEVGTQISGEGVSVAVRFVRHDGALPVPYIRADDPTEAAAIREIDLQRRFHWSPAALAKKLKLTMAKAKALRWK